MSEVKLSADEGLAAGVVGILQMMRAQQKGWVGNDHGGSSGRDIRERWAQSIHGAMAEFAVCKMLNRCWTPSAGGVSGGDVGEKIEVRATPWPSGCLIINEPEIATKSHSAFILVTGHWPSFFVRGWLFGEEAGRDEWWRPNEKPPSYWVPQGSLREMESLSKKEES